MKLYLLSDDPDTLIGLRLAGIQGILLSIEDDPIAEIQKISEDEEVGMLLITPNVAKKCGDSLTELKKKNRPLITEIPDSNPENNQPDGVTDYIRNAIGIKI